jgi:hypothetical protein
MLYDKNERMVLSRNIQPPFKKCIENERDSINILQDIQGKRGKYDILKKIHDRSRKYEKDKFVRKKNALLDFTLPDPVNQGFFLPANN